MNEAAHLARALLQEIEEKPKGLNLSVSKHRLEILARAVLEAEMRIERLIRENAHKADRLLAAKGPNYD